MPKSDQTIRVVLERSDDYRALLFVWRTGHDFYSAIAGSAGHRSYHETGWFLTNVGKWGKWNYHVEKEVKLPSREVNGTQILHGFFFKNDESLHFGDRPLKKYSGKKSDLLVKIKQSEVEGDSVLLVVSGFTSDPQHTKENYFDLIEYRSLELVKLEMLPSRDRYSMFVAVIQARSHFDNKIIGKELKKFLKVDSLVIPVGDIYQSVEGKSTHATLRLPNLGPAPPPANPEPPALPIKQEDWMPVHVVELSFRPLIGTVIMAGPLTIEALPSSSVVRQPMRVSLFRDARLAEEAGIKSMSIHIAYLMLELQYGQYKGHSEKQFALADQKFQISMISVSERKLGSDGTQVQIGSQEGEWFRTYRIKIVELTARL